MVLKYCYLDVIKECEECVKEFTVVSVWRLKKGGYAVLVYDPKVNKYVLWNTFVQAEFAICRASHLDSIL